MTAGCAARAAVYFPFTCFNGTKVQILTPEELLQDVLLELSALPGAQFTCFTITKVQILTPEELRARRRRENEFKALGIDPHIDEVSLLAVLVLKHLTLGI